MQFYLTIYVYIKIYKHTHTQKQSFICSSQQYLVVLAKRKILGAEWESAVHFPPCSACAPSHGAHVLPLSTQPASACIVICSALVLTMQCRCTHPANTSICSAWVPTPCSAHILTLQTPVSVVHGYPQHAVQCMHTHPANTSLGIAVVGVTVAVTGDALAQVTASLDAVEAWCTALSNTKTYSCWCPFLS